MTGGLDVLSLTCQTIYMQYMMLFSAMPMGIMMAACTLVGNAIGEGNIK